MPQFLIIIVLLLLICAGAMTLLLDARQRRIDCQLAIALPTSHSASLPSIRGYGGVPEAVSPSFSQLQGRDSLRLAPRVLGRCRCHRSSGNLLR